MVHVDEIVIDANMDLQWPPSDVLMYLDHRGPCAWLEADIKI